MLTIFARKADMISDCINGHTIAMNTGWMAYIRNANLVIFLVWFILSAVISKRYGIDIKVTVLNMPFVKPSKASEPNSNMAIIDISFLFVF